MNSFASAHSKLIILDVMLRVLVVYFMLFLRCIKLSMTNLDNHKYIKLLTLKMIISIAQHSGCTYL